MTTSILNDLGRPGALGSGAAPSADASPARERERLLEALAHQQRVAQGGLAVAGLCHELGTRLTGLLGDIYLALQDEDPEAWRRTLRSVQATATEMGDTTRTFLAFVQRAAKRREAAFLVGHAVEQAVRMMKPLSRRRRVNLVVEGASPEWVRGESRLLVQVLVNLISNGIEACAFRGEVTVRIEAGEDATVRLSVADDGPGLPERFHDRVYRSLASADQSFQGLGLYAVGQLSRELGSQVHFQTGARGTTFSLDLGVCDPPTVDTF